jgi:hypothetical protein
MILLTDIPNTDTTTLKKVAMTLQHMLDRRASTVHNKRTKKLKIDFKTSDNGHFNKLREAVALELGKRK